VLLPFSFRLLLYNVMQVVRAFVGEDGGALVAVVSDGLALSEVDGGGAGVGTASPA